MGGNLFCRHFIYAKHVPVELIEPVCDDHFRVKVADNPLHHAGRAVYIATLHCYDLSGVSHEVSLTGVFGKGSSQADAYRFIGCERVAEYVCRLSRHFSSQAAPSQQITAMGFVSCRFA